MTLNVYFGKFKGREVTVLGIGVSNLPLIRLLAGAGAIVTARDRRPANELGDTVRELESLGVGLVLGEQYLSGLPSGTIFITPGINPRRAEVADAVRRGATVTSEMEVFMRLCPCTVIGVTGSDGKTTTSTLIYQMLRAAGKKAWLGGNIGTPLLDRVGDMSPGDYAVVELSSFQLMTVSISPHIGVITNISPNHLDVHTDMDEYVSAKCAIFAGQKAGDTVILNADNAITRELARQAPGKTRLFSRVQMPEGGVWLDGHAIYSSGKPVMTRTDIKIPGLHNVENYMAAVAALDGIVPYDAMRRVAAEFPGVEHRLELVREMNGARYFNDSIGSSPSRTIAGLNCFEQKVILIAGGYDKLIPFDGLGESAVKKVKALLLCGDTAPKIEQAVRGAAGYAKDSPVIETFDTLEGVVFRAAQIAHRGDVVLFSPACASFDRYKNFEERGRHFKELVNSL